MPYGGELTGSSQVNLPLGCIATVISRPQFLEHNTSLDKTYLYFARCISSRLSIETCCEGYPGYCDGYPGYCEGYLAVVRVTLVAVRVTWL